MCVRKEGEREKIMVVCERERDGGSKKLSPYTAGGGLRRGTLIDVPC